jgi:hypothetical protein
LPDESSFVAAARESIPSTSVTTAQKRATTSTSADMGRGRGKSKKETPDAASTYAGTSQPTIGRGIGSSKRRTCTYAPSQPATERNRAKTYNTGPGSAHWLLFGDEQDGARHSNIPHLNADVLEKIQISQNAPAM